MSGVLVLFLLAALVITGFYVAGLLLHWFKFGYMYPWVWVAMPIYLVGIAFFILLMLGALAIA